MDRYYINNDASTNPNGDHEVHKEDCIFLPLKSRVDLGMHVNCKGAITAARVHYANVDGCKRCNKDCHSS